MLRCASLRREAADCLGLLNSDAGGGGADKIEAHWGAPMDVVDGGSRGDDVGIDGVMGEAGVAAGAFPVAGAEGGSGAPLEQNGR